MFLWVKKYIIELNYVRKQENNLEYFFYFDNF